MENMNKTLAKRQRVFAAFSLYLRMLIVSVFLYAASVLFRDTWPDAMTWMSRVAICSIAVLLLFLCGLGFLIKDLGKKIRDDTKKMHGG